MSANEDAINTLNSQFYNAVTSQMVFDKQKFQLCQGMVKVGPLNEDVWHIFDAIPPKSTTFFYDPTQAKLFSDGYKNVIMSLKMAENKEFEKVLGQDVDKFYTDLSKETIEITILDFWKKWAPKNRHIDDLQKGIDALTTFDDPVSDARKMLKEVNGKTIAYTVLLKDIMDKIRAMGSKTVTLNTKYEDTNVQNTWAKITAAGLYEIFYGYGKAQASKLTTKFLNSEIQMTLTFKHVLTVPAGPYSKPATGFSDYVPWYLSGPLSDAYRQNNYYRWQENGVTTWEAAFDKNSDPEGYLVRHISALAIVDGIDFKMTSKAKYDESEFKDFKDCAELGIWPFIYARESGGMTSSFEKNDHGDITVTMNSKEGNPIVFGIFQTPVEDYL